MRFERCAFTDNDLQHYVALFAACFPTAGKLQDLAYLRWLYVDNPLGHAIGFNAVDGDTLAAHYICTRARIRFDGRDVPALLSLNTATHPDYQGKGLFTRLADQTYEAAAAEGVALVYGVANANSTPGFVRKLGFSLVEPLESRVGLGPLGRFDWAGRVAGARFRQSWTTESLAWRLANPANPVRIESSGGDVVGLSAPTGKPLLRAWAGLPGPLQVPQGARHANGASMRVWLGLMPAGSGRFGLYPQLPARLRPSPLNLIFRPLAGGHRLECGESAFSFLDFDAF
ncbi:GNAT family N-acetyltransferase [Lysobacter xanthus]